MEHRVLMDEKAEAMRLNPGGQGTHQAARVHQKMRIAVCWL